VTVISTKSGHAGHQACAERRADSAAQRRPLEHQPQQHDADRTHNSTGSARRTAGVAAGRGQQCERRITASTTEAIKATRSARDRPPALSLSG
jgi:hypothetical protein